MLISVAFFGKETLELSLTSDRFVRVGEDVGEKGRKKQFCFPFCRGGKRKLKLETESQNINALCYHFCLFFRAKIN